MTADRLCIKKLFLTLLIIILIMLSGILMVSFGMPQSNIKAFAEGETEVNISLTQTDLQYIGESYLEGSNPLNPNVNFMNYINIEDINQIQVVIDKMYLNVTISSGTSLLKDAGSYTLSIVINTASGYTGSMIGQIVTILKYDIPAGELLPSDFIGIKNTKEYDTTVDMLLYDYVIYVYDNPYNDTFTKITDYFITTFKDIDNNSIFDSSQASSFITEFVCCNPSTIPVSQNYFIMRIDYYAAIYRWQGIMQDRTADGALLYQNVIDSLIGTGSSSLEQYLNNDSVYVNNYIRYNASADISNLYFTAFDELIKFETATVSGVYSDKNSAEEKGYTITFDGVTHSNYEINFATPLVDVNGADGIIIPTTIAIEYLSLNKIYGDANPANYTVPFIRKNQIDTVSGMTSSETGNIITLPYCLYVPAVSLNFSKVLSNFYSADLADAEIANLLNEGVITLQFSYEGVLNVYGSVEEAEAGTKKKHILGQVPLLTNYNFMPILNAYDSTENVEPCIFVEKKPLSVNTATIELSKEYNADSKVKINAASSDYSGIDGAYLSLNISADYYNADEFTVDSANYNKNGVLLSGATADYYIWMFEFILDYSDVNQEILIYNYDINEYSFMSVLDSDVNYNGVDFLVSITEGAWITLSDYDMNHSGSNILDYKITTTTPFNVSIRQAMLNIEVTPGQTFTYGNNILENLDFTFNNFYDLYSKSAFTINYQIKNPLGNNITDPGDNGLATPLVPDTNPYTIHITGVTIDQFNDWYLNNSKNYDLTSIYSTDYVAFNIEKGDINYFILDAEIQYGYNDPAFVFGSVMGNRDYDLAKLQTFLARTSATQENYNAGDSVEIELAVSVDPVYSYYNYTYDTNQDYDGEAILTINRRELNLGNGDINQFTVIYGTANETTKEFSYIYAYEKALENTNITPNPININITFGCIANTLNAGSLYEHDINSIISYDNSENFAISLTTGSIINVIKIVPFEVNLDYLLFSVDNFTKQYDATTLNLGIRELNTFDYQSELSGVNDPLTVDERNNINDCITIDFPALDNLPYYEYIFYAVVSQTDGNVSVGTKNLDFSRLVIARKDDLNFVATYKPDSNANYIFNFGAMTGEITKRDFEINTTPLGTEVYEKTYDGDPYSLAYSNDMGNGENGLLSSHYIVNDTNYGINFITATSDVSVLATALAYNELYGGFRIEDSGGNDITGNYNLVTTVFGEAFITQRRILIECNDIVYTYDSTKVALDIEGGEISSVSASVYTYTGNSAAINFYYDSSNTNENTLASVFVSNHILTGGLITSTANAVRSAMVADTLKQFAITNSTIDNYYLMYDENILSGRGIYAVIEQREVIIDINSDPVSNPLTKEYDGTVYSINLLTSMASNIISSHTITGGTRNTEDSNVLISNGNVVEKRMNTTKDLCIKDEAENDVTANYSFIYTERFATITKKNLTIDITLDSGVVTEKIYNKSIYEAFITQVMASGIIDGELVMAGTLKTTDADAGTNKELNCEGLLIQKYNTLGTLVDTNNNYQIYFSKENTATIHQKQIDVDMTKDYGESLRFIYTGSIIEFSISDNMIRDPENNGITGLLAFQHITSTATLKSASKDVAENVNVIFPAEEAAITDSTTGIDVTANYSFNFSDQITIIKRDLSINVGDHFSKVYDTLIFSSELLYISDGDNADGLVDGHRFLGSTHTIDELVEMAKPLSSSCTKIYTDEATEIDLQTNYNIIFISQTADITPRTLNVNITFRSKIYDGMPLEVAIIESMLEGLQGEDTLVSEVSVRRTNSSNFGSYSLDTDGEGVIIINKTGVNDETPNLIENYKLVYVNDGMVTIEQRTIYITVRNDIGYSYVDDYCVSGFIEIFKDANFSYGTDIMNEEGTSKYYHVDAQYINGIDKFDIISTDHYSSGSRKTESVYIGDRILLVRDVDLVIKNDFETDVTANYAITYVDSYIQILQRPISLDVAKNHVDYTINGFFIHKYDRNKYIIKLINSMVTIGEDLIYGHNITNGYVQTTNDYVERDGLYNVITKSLELDTDLTKTFAILDAAEQDITNNYDLTLVERFVKIIPQTLAIDVTKGVQDTYTKYYDGTPYSAKISNAMVVEGIDNAGGFIGQINISGDMDRIKVNSGVLVTANSDVSYNGNNEVVEQSLTVSNSVIIQDPYGINVTINYDIHYCRNIETETDWGNFLSGSNPDYYTPRARINPIDLQLSMNGKIQKYYDGMPFEFEFNYQNDIITCPSVIINEDLSVLLTVTGLSSGEKATFIFSTQDGSVGGEKTWIYNAGNFLVTKADNSDSKMNYKIKVLTYFAQIVKRPISIDIKKGTDLLPSFIYDGDFVTIDITGDMVKENLEDNGLPYCIGLIDGHTISQGRKISVSANTGEVQLEADSSMPIKIIDGEGYDCTAFYSIVDSINQKVEITPKMLTIDLNNSTEEGIETKIYDGFIFEIPLSGEGIVNGLINNHYVSIGNIVSGDKNVGTDKTANCDISLIVIKESAAIEGDPEINVTSNYDFTFVTCLLNISPKEIIIKAGSNFYKPYNGNTTVTLKAKHYAFDGLCLSDIVILTQYTVAFISPEAGGTGETLTVSNLEIDSENYYLGNATFDIIGQIIMSSPTVSVQDSRQIRDTDGVIFTYDGTEKKAVYSITGLEGVDVLHIVRYRDTAAAEGEYMTDAPVNAGLYEMILDSAGVDENYPNWAGATIMIQINPAEIAISFTGSFSQIYGEVTDITVRATSTGNFNRTLNPEPVPINSGYTYPEAGEYQIIATYNLDEADPNYLPVTKTVKLSIAKRDIEVVYGETDNLYYDGLNKNISVTIKANSILASDIEDVTDEDLRITSSGDYNVVRLAGNYQINVAIDSNNYSISNNSAEFSIAKQKLTVSALINNVSRAIINEGDSYNLIIGYSGFVNSENRSYLTKPAYLPYVPKTAMTDYEILPFGATSPNYYFDYVPCYLTILEKKVSNLTDGGGLATITGEYGSYSSLSAIQIETSVSDPAFYVINENIKKNLSNTDLLDNYEIGMAYKLTVDTDDTETSDTLSTIRLKLSSDLQGKTGYMVLHFDSEGNYELVGAVQEGEYLVFTSAGSDGDYIILTPRVGLSTATIILIFVAPVFIFVIIILFYTMFRRKY